MKKQPGLTEREHHAFGALLKRVEAIVVGYRYERYGARSKTGQALNRFINALNQLRRQLDHEFAYVAHPDDPRWLSYRGSDTYLGDEVRAVHRIIFELEEAPTGLARELFPPSPNERELFTSAIENLYAAGRGHTPRLPWDQPQRLLEAPDERHAAVRTALLENPDQPQSAFVKRYRVHPDTVQRTRRELEEAGAIPFLAHRHGPADHREASTQCERRDDIRGLADKTRRAKSPIETTTTAHHAETPATAGVRLSGEDEPSGDGAPISAVELARDNHWDGTNAVSERFSITHNR